MTRFAAQARVKWIAGIMFVLLAQMFGQQRLPLEWKQYQNLEVDQAGLIRVPIPMESLDAARPGLEDLRLFDANGREIPYLLERPIPEKSAELATVGLLNALRPDSTVATFRNPANRPVNAMILETPAREFMKSAQLEGSRDGTRWMKIVVDAPLYRQEDGSAGLEIRFPAAEWGYFRLTLDNRRTAAIPVTGARLRTAPPEIQPRLPLEVRITDREELDGITHLTVMAEGANAVISRVEIDTPEPLFSRHIELYARRLIDGEIRETLFARGSVARVAPDSAPAELRLDYLEGFALPAKEFIVCITNNNSPPLQLRSVKVWRYPAYLIWEAANPGIFTLLSGNPGCAAPRYDLSALSVSLKAKPTEPRAVSALAANPAYRTADLAPEFPQIAAAIDTAGWTYRKRIKPGQPGMQQLELDPEVLAHGLSSLRDLRLVRTGNQVPYLIERTMRRRFLSPTLAADSAKKESRLSRWILHLPYKNLPIDTVSFNTDSMLFQRQVELLESQPAGRSRNHSPLARAVWTRSPGAGKEKLELTLPRPPATEELIFEIDNGDNPPLDLRDVKVSYLISRLVFRWTGPEEIYLYYGNRKSNAPRYDIQFVARDLLAVEKAMAALEREEVLGPGFFSGTSEDAQWPGWIYWGALAIVVIVLFAVIRRLLPQTQNPPQ
jgi:hypothetical protein